MDVMDWRDGHLWWRLVVEHLWWRLVVGVWLHVWLFERRHLALLLLAKDLNYLSKLCESGPFSFNVLPSCFGPMSHCLPYGDGLLFLMEPLNLLVHPG
jgi:hypothetical protein